MGGSGRTGAERKRLIMKEIDFLPEWYKRQKRRQIGIRRQYLALGCILAAMVVWNFITAGTVSRAEARIADICSKHSESQILSKRFDQVQSQLTQLCEETAVLEEIDSRINVAAVLAEMSFLIDKEMVLSTVKFTAQRVKSSKSQQAGRVGLRRADIKTEQPRYLGDVIFEIVISGLASEAGDVAGLVCRLEESPYFCNVIPLFSRNAMAKTKMLNKPGVSESPVTEFEITCQLANYRQVK